MSASNLMYIHEWEGLIDAVARDCMMVPIFSGRVRYDDVTVEPMSMEEIDHHNSMTAHFNDGVLTMTKMLKAKLEELRNAE